MDLGETMVKPGGNDNRIFVPVFRQPSEEVLYLGVNMNGGAILMDSPIGPLWVVGLLLKFSFKEWNFKSVAKLINRCGCILVPSQDRVKFVDQALG